MSSFTPGVLALVEAGLLVICALLVRKSPTPLRFIIWLQSGFWGLAFVARPLAIWITKPLYPRPLADYRLAHSDYGDELSHVLAVVILGTALYALALQFTISCRWVQRLSNSRPYTPSGQQMAPFLALYVAGWMGRIASLAAPGNKLAIAFSPFAIPAACLLLSNRAGPGSQRWHRLRIGGILASESAASLLAHSKTPLLSALIAVGLREALAQRRVAKAPKLILLGMSVMSAFLILQPLKGVNTSETVSRYSDSSHPTWTGAYTSVLERSDLLGSVTDAYFLPAGEWISWGDYSSRLYHASIPLASSGAIGETAGVQWTREVRARSNPLQQANVSLADGYIAEGWALAGPFGLMGAAAALAITTVLASIGLTSRRASIAAFFSCFYFGMTLLERGPLGVAGALGKAIEAATVVLVLQFVLGALHRSSSGALYKRSNNASQQRLRHRAIKLNQYTVHRLEIPIGD